MKYWVLCAIISLLSVTAKAQKAVSDSSETHWKIPELKINLKKDGSRYLKFNLTAQVWLRFDQSNPGTLLNDKPRKNTMDIGLRRVRIQFIGNVHKRFFVYTQFGINNFNSVSGRKPGIFFHDVALEYHAIQKYLTVGGGLTGWTGFLRYSSPAVGSILSADAPLYQQATNDINDQFLRKLSVYAKGKIASLDYRVVLSDPFVLRTSSFYDPDISQNASFSPTEHNFQVSAYVNWQFYDQESNMTPYFTGSYLGTQKVMNVGIGGEYQPNATWYQRNNDTLLHDMLFIGADYFVDMPLGKDGQYALTAYGAYSYTDFGPGYLRSVAPMNPSNGYNPANGSLNGPGNGTPILGTGHTGYLQAGLMLPRKWFGKKGITLQPYAGGQVSAYDRLSDPMILIDGGVNVLFSNHQSKLSLNIQNRPVFNNTGNETGRQNSIFLQYQIAL